MKLGTLKEFEDWDAAACSGLPVTFEIAARLASTLNRSPAFYVSAETRASLYPGEV